MNVLDDLSARGLVHDMTDVDELRRVLDEPISLYHGIDPTADSLHVGNLVGVLVLRRFQDAGHRPVALVGGATGMIGDPSGRSDERNLLDEATLAHNAAGIRGQLEQLLDFDRGATMVDNLDWTAPMSLIQFLRDVGKHTTVNQMVAKESVRSRMDSDDGISYTEFSYMLLQAHDYLWLNQHEDCVLQIGGSDQWGNITAGIDLIRRRGGGGAHGLTWPLVTKADGSKFGKTAEGNVWLDPARTSPYRFYQHWIQTDDADLRRFFLQLTLLAVAEVDEIVGEHERAPEQRSGQRHLAAELTGLVHGADAVHAAQAASAVLFGSPVESIAADAFDAIAGEVATTTVARDALDTTLLELLILTDLVASKGEARRALAEGSIYVNNERRSDDRIDPETDLLHGRFVLLRRGKRRYHLVAVR